MSEEEKAWSITFTYVGGEKPVTFTEPEAAASWIEAELEFWDWISSANVDSWVTNSHRMRFGYPQSLGNLKSVFNHITNDITNHTRPADDPDRSSKLRKLSEVYANRVSSNRLISRNHPCAHFISKLQEDGQIPNALHTYMSVSGAYDTYENPYLPGPIQAQLIMNGERPAGWQEHIEQVCTSVASQVSEVGDQLAQTVKERQELLDGMQRLDRVLRKGFKRRYDQYAADHRAALESTLNALRNTQITYLKFMKLAAPAKYWRHRKRGHWAIAAISLVALGLCFYFGGSLIYTESQELIAAIASNGAQGGSGNSDPEGLKDNIVNAAFLTRAASVGVYVFLLLLLLRFFGRVSMSQMHLATHAGERSTMIQTYLALTEGEEIDQSQMNMLLESIFKSSNTGLINTDVVPSSVMGMKTE